MFGVSSGGLFAVAEEGGAPRPVTEAPERISEFDGHRYPYFLPDGEHFLFLNVTSGPEAGVFVGALNGTAPTRVLDGEQPALYAPPTAPGGEGHLLFRRDNDRLMAMPFSAERLAATAGMLPVARGVGRLGNTNHVAFSVATDGTLAFTAAVPAMRELLWVDRSGARVNAASPAARVEDFALDPDDRRIALVLRDLDTRVPDIWFQEPGNSTPEPFTLGSGAWILPVWSPDGGRVAFASSSMAGRAEYEIRARASDRSGTAQALVRSDEYLSPWDWTPDGQSGRPERSSPRPCSPRTSRSRRR